MVTMQWVISPRLKIERGGVTTMKYDVVDRLIERVLPNGDVKLSLHALAGAYAGVGGNPPYQANQFKAIANHAKNFGSLFTGFITLKHGGQQEARHYLELIQREAIEHNVVALVLTIFDN